MGDLLTTLRENWSVIADAPLAFAIWTIVLLAICWWVVGNLKSNQIGDLQSRVSLRDDEIADYKRKLEGASPDEAAARIEALEAEIANLRPRRLSSEQLERIADAATSFRGAVSLLANVASPDATPYAASIARSFAQAGWKVTTPSVMGMGNAPPSGLGVLTNGGPKFREAETTVIGALRAAGLDPDIIHLPNRACESVEVLVCSPF